MLFQTVNPTTETIIKTYPNHKWNEVYKKIKIAQNAFLKWRETSYAERKKCMINMARYLKKESSKLGKIITEEMGKPIQEAIGEVNKCALNFEYYAENGEKFMADQFIKTESKKSYIKFEPLGIILEIMPWNFPFWQVMRISASMIMAGNVALLKHAPSVPKSALTIEKAFAKNFPKGIFQNLFVQVSEIKKIIENENIKGVTFTGSDTAGSKVASLCAKEIKKVILELGGSDPFMVFEDADLEKATKMCSISRFLNCGQVCIAAKRILVQEKILDKFLEKFKNKIANIKIGDPKDKKTQLGPLHSKEALETIEKQVRKSIKMGAKIVLGGKKINRKGYFFEPTILQNINPEMSVYKEEIFGPVAVVMQFKDLEEAVKIANDTPYGLGASVWTKNTKIIKKIIPKLEVGRVFVNDMVKTDPRLPVGGVKRSGLGRELSHYGMHEFSNIKTVNIN